MDCVTPNSPHRSANSRLVYCAPWSVWKTAPAMPPRVAAAAFSASATSSVRMWSAIDHPARRREKQSTTVAEYRNSPSPTGRYVMSPTYLVFGADPLSARGPSLGGRTEGDSS